MKKELYIIRGTGFNGLDGTLVTIEREEGDGFVIVAPFNSTLVEPESIKVDSRYLQFVNKNLQEYTYNFNLTKLTFPGTYDQSGEASRVVHDAITFQLNGVRNVDLNVIEDFIKSNLSHILKME